VRRRLLACALAAAALRAVPVAASEPAAPADAQSIIDRMMERNPSLQTYEARVHVDVRMLNFPWLAPTLDGTSYYKRPDTYMVVFDHVPGYAKGFSKLFDDVGDPAAWEKDENIAFVGMRSLGGKPMLVLRLTKKIHSDILDHTLAYIDPSSYALVQMEWYYTSGGKITMTQQYRRLGPYTVLAGQHATIDIPHVHAIADASYGQYKMNVAVAAPVAGETP
jgi:outer membrane lipoprotein-sorting protein